MNRKIQVVTLAAGSSPFLPIDAEILDVVPDNGGAVLIIATRGGDTPLKERKLAFVGIGGEIPPAGIYRGTFSTPDGRYFVFEIPS